MRSVENPYTCRSEAYEDSDDISLNPSSGPTLGDIVNARFSRRDLLKGTPGVAALGATWQAAPWPCWPHPGRNPGPRPASASRRSPTASTRRTTLRPATAPRC